MMETSHSVRSSYQYQSVPQLSLSGHQGQPLSSQMDTGYRRLTYTTKNNADFYNNIQDREFSINYVQYTTTDKLRYLKLDLII